MRQLIQSYFETETAFYTISDGSDVGSTYAIQRTHVVTFLEKLALYNDRPDARTLAAEVVVCGTDGYLAMRCYYDGQSRYRRAETQTPPPEKGSVSYLYVHHVGADELLTAEQIACAMDQLDELVYDDADFLSYLKERYVPK